MPCPMSALQRIFTICFSVISMLALSSCEPEENFGFPRRINLSGNGETIEIKGDNDLPPGIIQLQILDYNGDGHNSWPSAEGKDCLETTTDWLTAKYTFADYKLTLIAEPNKTERNRKLYLYLLSGNSRQEITVTQSK